MQPLSGFDRVGEESDWQFFKPAFLTDISLAGSLCSSDSPILQGPVAQAITYYVYSKGRCSWPANVMSLERKPGSFWRCCFVAASVGKHYSQE